MEDLTLNKNPRIPSVRNQETRELTQDDADKLAQQNSRMVKPFIAQKLETEAKKYWDQFYKRNKTNFFKDRHWTTSEFKELLGDSNCMNGKCLLEVGCGVGNLVFPLLEDGTNFRIFACDFSERAVDFLKAHSSYDPSKVTAFVADITCTNLSENLEGIHMDIVTLVFVLSAIHPEKVIQSLLNVFSCLKPGGLVLFRDYALHDMTQIRFKTGHKIDDNLYMRQDGTRTFFFSVEKVKLVFAAAGFQEIDCCYVHCRTINKKEGVDAPRTFVQAKFIKPP